MNIATMEMNPNIARVHYKEYRKKVREHRALRLALANKNVVEGGKMFRAGRIAKSAVEKEDETLMESYRVMAQGQRIVNVASVLHGAGLNKQKLPNLALAGADWEHCHLRWGHRDRFEFYRSAWGPGTRGYGENHKYVNGGTGFPLHTFGAELQNQEWRKGQGLPTLPARALVPSVPVHLRPAGDLSGYHVLFEAEWTAVPPVDPILLKHVHGYMYVVLAQWNLTDLERSVLSGRLT
jgi:hypothetical protein